MSARPSPTKFKVQCFLVQGLDISCDNLVHLNMGRISLGIVLHPIIQEAPLLETRPPASLYPLLVTIIRRPHLRTLELAYISCVESEEIELLTKFLNFLELPFLGWLVHSHTFVVEFNFMTSFLVIQKSLSYGLATGIKYFVAVGDFERLFQAAPHLQHLFIQGQWTAYSSMKDNILEQLSVSAPASQTSDNAGFLSDLQSLEPIGQGLTAWRCIFRWPHRKLLSLKIMMLNIMIDDGVSGQLARLLDQGIDLHIAEHLHGDYL